MAKKKTAEPKYPTYLEKSKIDRIREDRQHTVWSEEIAKKCDHEWQPVSMAFEIQLLNQHVQIRQPDLNNGKCYCVCMKCCSHTYIETGFIGYCLNSPDLLENRKTE